MISAFIKKSIFGINREPQGKVANFFTFPKYRNGRLGTTFEVRYHFGLPGGGRNGQNCPNFIREYLVGSIRKKKILTKIDGKLDILQATFWLFFCWDILVSSRYEVGRKKFA